MRGNDCEMSSEDEYYEYPYARRSSKRARRRASSPRRRETIIDYDMCSRKSRRNKNWNTLYGPRVAVMLVLFLLIIYEFIVLKGTTLSSTENVTEKSSRASNSRSTTSQTGNYQQHSGSSDNSISNPALQEAPPRSSENGTIDAEPVSVPKLAPDNSSKLHSSNPQNTLSRRSALEKVAAAAEVGADRKPIQPSETSRARHNSPRDETGSRPESKAYRNPESAIKMERKAADEDPDVENDSIGRKRFSAGQDSSSSASRGRPPKFGTAADRGAEPGAGENFWNWFQETKGSEKKSVSKSISCPEKSERLCLMFYKYIRKYKIRTIFDVSCEKNLDWMGSILKKAGTELWGFKYYCSLWSGENAEDARSKLGGLPFVEFNEEKWWRTGFAQETELLFAWDTLAHLAYGRVWNFFVKARKQEIKYVLVDNYPGILNDPSPKRDYLNLRKHPFRFPSAKEVAQNVTEPGETAKRQLLLYETSMLPDNLQ